MDAQFSWLHLGNTILLGFLTDVRVSQQSRAYVATITCTLLCNLSCFPVMAISFVDVLQTGKEAEWTKGLKCICTRA